MNARRVAVVVGYWLLWIAAWRIAIPHEVAPRISIWWPPSGLSLAFLLLFGLRYLPAVAVPQLALMALVLPGQPLIWVAVTAIVCAGYGGVAAATRRIAGTDPFTTARGASAFFAAAAFGAAIVAVLGSVVLNSVEDGPWSDVRGLILAWWTGDLAALAIFTPFLVVWLAPLRDWLAGAPPADVKLGLALATDPALRRALLTTSGATLLALAVTFAGVAATGYTWYFVLFLPAMYAGYALGPRASTAASMVVVLFSLSLLRWQGALTTSIDLQFFMIATAVAALLFAIVVDDWRAARRTLLDQQAELEHRVRDRTQRLEESNALLEMEIRARKHTGESLAVAKNAAEASYRELESIYRHATVGLALIDRDLRYLRINDTLAKVNGVPVADHLGRTVFDIVPDVAGAVEPYLCRVIDTGEAVVAVEVNGRTAGHGDGARVWLDHFYPLKRPDGSVEAVNVVVQDITERRAAEEELRRAKDAAERASALKSRFLAATSHDLRQPLQTIALLHSIVVDRVKDEDTRRVVLQMGVAVDVMTDTLNALLDIDGLEKGRLQPKIEDFPIQRLFERMRDEFQAPAEDKTLSLKTIVCEGIIRSDQRLLERLVENYVANAVKYTERGKILVGCRRRGPVIRIEVWDTGVGIPADEHEMIFEQFYRGRSALSEREQGRGLGLALVRSLADILGHRVGMRSIEARGSMFFVEVPLGEQMASTGASPMPKHPVDVRGALQIVLIEDDPAVQESLKLLLVANGCAVAATASGEEAVRLAEEGAARPDLIIADHNLAGVISGVEAAERIRGHFGTIPGLILTGEPSHDKLDRYSRLGLQWMQKPVKAEDLLARIRELIGDGNATRIAAIANAGGKSAIDDGPANVFIVEDDDGLRDAMVMVLEAKGFHPRAFANADDFLSAFAPAQSCCVLIDIGLPGMNGLQLQQQLKVDGVDVPIIIVSGRGEVALAVQAMRDGAVDFLQKPVNDIMLVEAVARALRRSAEAADGAEEAEEIEARIARLTAREREILVMVAAGLANKEVAARLRISQRTVENHRARVMQKMKARSLADLVRATHASARIAEGLPPIPAP